MAVTDDFNRADEDLEASSNWILQDGTAGSIRIVSNTARTRNKDNWYSYRHAVDQGPDAYIQAHQMYFASQAQIDGMAVRVVDRDNWVAYTFGGTGSAGRRLSKCVAGVITDLITSQGVSGEWLKVEAVGTTVKLFEGGTGATPAWTQVGSDQTISEHSTEASQGFIGYSSSYGEFWSYFEAGSLSAGGSSTGTGTGVLSSITGTVAGSSVVPDFSGTATGLLQLIYGNAAGTAGAPSSTGTATGTISAIIGSASGATTVPAFTGNAAGYLNQITGTGAGSVDNPGYNATASGILSQIAGSATGNVINSGIVGAGDGVLSSITGLSSGIVLNPVTGTGTGVLSVIAGVATGEITTPVFSGAGAGYLQSITGNASGVFFTGDASGVGAGVINAITGNAAGLIVNPDTGEILNLQFDWKIQKNEMSFTQRDRSLILYE